MAVITISAQMGSLGTEIARQVANQIGYEYLDRETIEKELTSHGLTAQEVRKYDEKRPSFWVKWKNQGRDFLYEIQAMLYRAAQKDNVVIVGHGAQVLLRGIPGTLHVKIVAPFQERVQRLLSNGSGNEEDLSQILKQSDRDSAGFISSFFDADEENLYLYDLVINTHFFTIDRAVETILRGIPTNEMLENIQRSRERLNDLILHGRSIEAF